MADRNPTKKRRQAQNRALREARAARAAAASTDPEDRRTSASGTAEEAPRRRRWQRDSSERSAPRPARSPIVKGKPDDATPARTPSRPAAPAAQATPNVKSVFSARPDRDAADANGGARPARTASGVARSTGIVSAAPPRRRSTAGTTAHALDEPNDHDDELAAEDIDDESWDDADDGHDDERQPPRASGRPLPPWLDRFGGNEPGGRWVLMSLLMVLVASVVVATTPVVPEQVEVDGSFEATGKMVGIWHFGVAQGLVYLLPPIFAVGLAILFARPGDRRRSWNYGLFALVLLSLMGGGIYIYAVAIGCFAFGCWQARKAALAEFDGDAAAMRSSERASRARRIADRAEERRARRDAR